MLKFITKHRATALGVSAAAILVACGGGGSTTATPTTPIVIAPPAPTPTPVTTPDPDPEPTSTPTSEATTLTEGLFRDTFRNDFKIGAAISSYQINNSDFNGVLAAAQVWMFEVIH